MLTRPREHPSNEGVVANDEEQDFRQAHWVLSTLIKPVYKSQLNAESMSTSSMPYLVREGVHEVSDLGGIWFSD